MTTKTKISPIERANKAILEGQLWRAKEILSGNIGTRKFEPELYQYYGELLLKMGDLIEAGKYLFLSGARKPEYDESINLYVKKYTKKNHWNLFGTFPAKARFDSLDKYPEETRKELDLIGFPSKWHKVHPGAEPVTVSETLKSKTGEYLGLTFIIFLLISLVVGVFTGAWKIIVWIGKLIP